MSPGSTDLSSISDKSFTGDEACALRCQKHGDGGNVRPFAKALHRHLGMEHCVITDWILLRPFNPLAHATAMWPPQQTAAIGGWSALARDASPGTLERLGVNRVSPLLRCPPLRLWALSPNED